MELFNYKQHCRICLKGHNASKNIFSHIVEGYEEPLVQILVALFEIELHSHKAFPQFICRKCLTEVENILLFKEDLLRNQEFLSGLFQAAYPNNVEKRTDDSRTACKPNFKAIVDLTETNQLGFIKLPEGTVNPFDVHTVPKTKVSSRHNVHVKTETIQSLQSEKSAKEFVCQYCNESFKINSALQDHYSKIHCVFVQTDEAEAKGTSGSVRKPTRQKLNTVKNINISVEHLPQQKIEFAQIQLNEDKSHVKIDKTADCTNFSLAKIPQASFLQNLNLVTLDDAHLLKTQQEYLSKTRLKCVPKNHRVTKSMKTNSSSVSKRNTNVRRGSTKPISGLSTKKLTTNENSLYHLHSRSVNFLSRYGCRKLDKMYLKKGKIIRTAAERYVFQCKKPLNKIHSTHGAPSLGPTFRLKNTETASKQKGCENIKSNFNNNIKEMKHNISSSKFKLERPNSIDDNGRVDALENTGNQNNAMIIVKKYESSIKKPDAEKLKKKDAVTSKKSKIVVGKQPEKTVLKVPKSEVPSPSTSKHPKKATEDNGRVEALENTGNQNNAMIIVKKYESSIKKPDADKLKKKDAVTSKKSKSVVGKQPEKTDLKVPKSEVPSPSTSKHPKTTPEDNDRVEALENIGNQNNAMIIVNKYESSVNKPDAEKLKKKDAVTSKKSKSVVGKQSEKTDLKVPKSEVPSPSTSKHPKKATEDNGRVEALENRGNQNNAMIIVKKYESSVKKPDAEKLKKKDAVTSKKSKSVVGKQPEKTDLKVPKSEVPSPSTSKHPKTAREDNDRVEALENTGNQNNAMIIVNKYESSINKPDADKLEKDGAVTSKKSKIVVGKQPEKTDLKEPKSEVPSPSTSKHPKKATEEYEPIPPKSFYHCSVITKQASFENRKTTKNYIKSQTNISVKNEDLNQNYPSYNGNSVPVKCKDSPGFKIKLFRSPSLDSRFSDDTEKTVWSIDDSHTSVTQQPISDGDYHKTLQIQLERFSSNVLHQQEISRSIDTFCRPKTLHRLDKSKTEDRPMTPHGLDMSMNKTRKLERPIIISPIKSKISKLTDSKTFILVDELSKTELKKPVLSSIKDNPFRSMSPIPKRKITQPVKQQKNIPLLDSTIVDLTLDDKGSLVPDRQKIRRTKSEIAPPLTKTYSPVLSADKVCAVPKRKRGRPRKSTSLSNDQVKESFNVKDKMVETQTINKKLAQQNISRNIIRKLSTRISDSHYTYCSNEPKEGQTGRLKIDMKNSQKIDCSSLDEDLDVLDDVPLLKRIKCKKILVKSHRRSKIPAEGLTKLILKQDLSADTPIQRSQAIPELYVYPPTTKACFTTSKNIASHHVETEGVTALLALSDSYEIDNNIGLRMKLKKTSENINCLKYDTQETDYMGHGKGLQENHLFSNLSDSILNRSRKSQFSDKVCNVDVNEDEEVHLTLTHIDLTLDTQPEDMDYADLSEYPRIRPKSSLAVDGSYFEAKYKDAGRPKTCEPRERFKLIENDSDLRKTLDRSRRSFRQRSDPDLIGTRSKRKCNSLTMCLS